MRIFYFVFLFQLASKKSILIAWSKTTVYAGFATFRFVTLTDTAKLKDFLKLPQTDTLEVMSVEYLWHPLEAAVLLSHCSVCTTNTRNIRIVIYSAIFQTWTLQDFELQVPKEAVLGFRFLYSAIPDIIMWDQHHVYYSYKNFTVVGTISTSSGETNLSSLSQGSNIHQVFTGRVFSILLKVFCVSLY